MVRLVVGTECWGIGGRVQGGARARGRRRRERGERAEGAWRPRRVVVRARWATSKACRQSVGAPGRARRPWRCDARARVVYGGDGKVEQVVGGRREVGRARRGITKAMSKACRRRPRVEGKCGKGRAAESESEEGSRGEAGTGSGRGPTRQPHEEEEGDGGKGSQGHTRVSCASPDAHPDTTGRTFGRRSGSAEVSRTVSLVARRVDLARALRLFARAPTRATRSRGGGHPH